MCFHPTLPIPVSYRGVRLHWTVHGAMGAVPWPRYSKLTRAWLRRKSQATKSETRHE